MRTISLKEYVLEEFNRMLAEEGRDVRVVVERPRPRLVSESQNVVQLRSSPRAQEPIERRCD
jgi:hypothetical protein